LADFHLFFYFRQNSILFQPINLGLLLDYAVSINSQGAIGTEQ